jgi:hypothetical protein
VQPAFEVAEKYGNGFNPLFLRQVLEAVGLNLFRGKTIEPLFLGLQV